MASQQKLIDRRKEIVRLCTKLQAKNIINPRTAAALINEAESRNSVPALDNKINRLEHLLVKKVPAHDLTSKNFHKSIAHDVALKSALNHTVKEASYNLNAGKLFNREMLPRKTEIINELRTVMGQIDANAAKYRMKGYALFKKKTEVVDGVQHYTFKRFWLDTPYEVVTSLTNLDADFTANTNMLDQLVDDVQLGDSQWILDKVEKAQVDILSYNPLRGGDWFELPDILRFKKCCVNPKPTTEKDKKLNECFKYSVLAGVAAANGGTTEQVGRVSALKKIDNLNWTGLTFPLAATAHNFTKFENQNDEISINVIGIIFKGKDNENMNIFPLYSTKALGRKYKLDIVYTINPDTKVGHYVYLSNISRLMHKDKKQQLYYCYHCFNGFYSPEKRDKHIFDSRCDNPDRDLTIDELPDEKHKWVEFTNVDKTIKHPVVLYADYECCVSEHIEEETETATKKVQHHTASGFKICAVNLEGRVIKSKLYTGNNAVEVMNSTLFEWKDELQKLVNPKVPMVISQDEEDSFKCAGECYLCNEAFTSTNYAVRDHDHQNGKYLGAAHNNCNLKRQYRKSMKIPVFFHNLKNYDGHLILKHLKAGNKPRCIATNFEKFISFSYAGYEFKDSCQFMPSSLDALVKNLKREDKKITINHFKQFGYDDEKIDLILRKGVFPYEWFNDMSKLEETELPERAQFFNQLALEECSLEDYEHAKNVWTAFNCQTFRDYHNLYMETDVLLLADVFENFRNVCINAYEGLDPAHYYTAPGLSWDAMLKITKQKLELLTDVDMYRFCEMGRRGGISMISNRYAKANNKYMENYNPEEETSYLMYWDANNLYGWAMSQMLPTGGFKWVEDVDVVNYNAEGKRGCMLEVDLEYPEHLHDLHNDYPMAPERMEITDDMLGIFQNEVLEQNKAKHTKCKKLVPNLMKKTRYILHIKNLQLYLKHGLVLKKVHRVLEFNQSKWLAKYIQLNTDMRTVAKNDFEKDFYKLMNNSVFGKTMENVRNRVDIKIVDDEKKMSKLVCSPLFKDKKIINENGVVAVQMNKAKVMLDKPIYVGACILDLSKVLMYQFHYETIKPMYGEDAKLIFTDTDSLCYHIKTDDVYNDVRVNKDLFDNSEYSEEHQCFDKTNKKVIGKFKDECGDYIMTEIAANRPKSYAYEKELMGVSKEVKRLKGVGRAAIKHDMSLDDYRNCVLERESKKADMRTFRSYDHEIYTLDLTKVALSAFDDKRHIDIDGIHTFAHGHYKI